MKASVALVAGTKQSVLRVLLIPENAKDRALAANVCAKANAYYVTYDEGPTEPIGEGSEQASGSPATISD